MHVCVCMRVLCIEALEGYLRVCWGGVFSTELYSPSTIAPPMGSFHSLLDGEVGIDHPLSALPW